MHIIRSSALIPFTQARTYFSPTATIGKLKLGALSYRHLKYLHIGSSTEIQRMATEPSKKARYHGSASDPAKEFTELHEEYQQTLLKTEFKKTDEVWTKLQKFAAEHPEFANKMPAKQACFDNILTENEVRFVKKAYKVINEPSIIKSILIGVGVAWVLNLTIG